MKNSFLKIQMIINKGSRLSESVLFDIREVFIDDLYKWIMVKEAELNPNGIGMLNIYDYNYPEVNKVHILVPIKKPV